MNVEKILYLPFVAIIPRGTRTDYNFECSCSNSCEKVLELLLKNDEKMTFEENRLTFTIPLNTVKITEETKKLYKEIRNICNNIIQNREHTLANRLIQIGKMLQNIQNSINEKQPINYELIKCDFLSDISFYKDIGNSLRFQEKLVSIFALRSPSIQFYADQVSKYFHNGNEIDQYNKAKSYINEIFPNIEVMFEKVIHNHIFFEQFPFSKQVSTLWDEFLSLCGVYLFIKYLAYGYMVDKTSLNDFVDVISAAFRLINHTSFTKNVNILLSKENISTLDQLVSLIQD